MDDTEGEIEYLDEDEDLIQKCFETLQQQPGPGVITIKPPKSFGGIRQSPLAVRECLKPIDNYEDDDDAQNYKRRYEDDSDYDPTLDEEEPKKKKRTLPKRAAKKTPNKVAKQPEIIEVKVANTPKKQGVAKKPVKVEVKVFKKPTKKPAKVEVKVGKKHAFSEGKIAKKLVRVAAKVAKNTANVTAKVVKKHPMIEFAKNPENKEADAVTFKSRGITIKSEKSPGKTITTIKKKTSNSVPKKNSNSVPIKESKLSKIADASDPFKMFPTLKQIKFYDYKDDNMFKLLNRDIKLTRWNQICRQFDSKFEQRKNKTSHSRTTQIIRQVKTMVNGRMGMGLKLFFQRRTDSITDCFQALLPDLVADKIGIDIDFDGRKLVNSNPRRLRSITLLTKEINKDLPVLVAFSPTQFRSTCFDSVHRISKLQQTETKYNDIKMLSSCKMCVECYQYSWRRTKKNKEGTKPSATCSVCRRVFPSVYNLLSHIRTHSKSESDEVKAHQSAVLRELVAYHYTCRICQQVSPSIQTLRAHLRTHAGPRPFHCEVGHHETN